MDKQQRGRLGGLGWVAKYGGDALSANGRNARQRKAEATVDPDGALSPRDRAVRAEALIRAQNIRASALGVAARKRSCAWCLRERGEPFPDVSSSICPRHAREELSKARRSHAQQAA